MRHVLCTYMHDARRGGKCADAYARRYQHRAKKRTGQYYSVSGSSEDKTAINPSQPALRFEARSENRPTNAGFGPEPRWSTAKLNFSVQRLEEVLRAAPSRTELVQWDRLNRADPVQSYRLGPAKSALLNRTNTVQPIRFGPTDPTRSTELTRSTQTDSVNTSQTNQARQNRPDQTGSIIQIWRS